MGNEFGQLREWDEKRAQDWLLRKYPIHDAFYHYMARLNHLYLTCPAFYAWDYREGGFTWLDCHQEERCIYAIRRLCGEDCLIGILNLSDSLQEDFRIPADALSPSEHPEPRLLLHTDWEPFGGKTKEDTLPWRQEEGSFYFFPPSFFRNPAFCIKQILTRHLLADQTDSSDTRILRFSFSRWFLLL